MHLRVSPWIISPAANLLIGLLGIATSGLTARVLGPSDRGVLAAAMIWPSLVFSLGAVVNTQSVAYFWAKAKVTGTCRTIWSASLIWSGLLTLILLPVSWMINWLALGEQAPVNLIASNIYAWMIPFSLLSACLVPIFLAEERFNIFWGIRIGSAVLYLVLLLVLYLAGLISVINCVLVSLASLIGTTIYALVLYLKSFDWSFSWNPDVFKSMAVYGTKINLSGFPYQLNVRLDQLLMSLLLPERVLGYYVVAVAWSSILGFLGSGVSTTMLSRSVLTDRQDQSRLSDLLAQFRLANILLVVLGVGAAIIAPLGIPLLFGSDFRPSVFPAMVLCLASLFMNINLVLHELTRGLGFPNLGVRAEMAGLLVTAPLLALLLPVWQGTGAALVALISRLCVLGVFIHLFTREINVPVTECVMPLRADWVRARDWLERGRQRLFL